MRCYQSDRSRLKLAFTLERLRLKSLPDFENLLLSPQESSWKRKILTHSVKTFVLKLGWADDKKKLRLHVV